MMTGQEECKGKKMMTRFQPLKNRRHNNQQGLTLVELMVVIVILGLLTTIIVINVLPERDRAQVQKVKADIATLETAMEQYRLDNFNYPTTSQGLQALTSAPDNLSSADRYRPGGYIKALPNDPWGNEYVFENPGTIGAFDIYSYGADGRQGGEGINADIGNWK